MFGLFKTKKGTAGKKKAKRHGKKGKKAFGGYSISFAGRKETVEQVFGKGHLAPSEMTKKLWHFIKSKRLASK